MKRRFALFVFLVAVCGICGAQSRPGGEEEVAGFVEKYDNAWNQREMATVERMLAPDYVYFSSKGQVRSRESLLQLFGSAKYKLESAERSELKVYRTMDTAVVSSRWKGHGTFDGREFHDDQRCSIVLVRGNEGWVVLAEHCTQIVP